MHGGGPTTSRYPASGRGVRPGKALAQEFLLARRQRGTALDTQPQIHPDLRSNRSYLQPSEASLPKVAGPVAGHFSALDASRKDTGDGSQTNARAVAADVRSLEQGRSGESSHTPLVVSLVSRIVCLTRIQY